MSRTKITAFLLIVFTMLFSLATSASAISEENMKKLMQISEQERKFLLMYFDEDELFVVSTTRSLKSIDRIAENVEVVTAADIELMNAHTLADVLNSVTGVQVQTNGGPGAFSFTYIQGSDQRHVAVFMDGVLLNVFTDNVADIGMIPVQLVEKIEIIKGPASSAWGSSLGGVINIITKSGSFEKKSGGTLSGSYGEQTFVDLRAELYGKKDKIGYYFYAGRMQADGFNGLPSRNGVSFSNLYLKLSHDIGKDSDIIFSVFYNTGERGWGDAKLDYLVENKIENLLATLSLNTKLAEKVNLSLSARTLSKDWKAPELTSGYYYHSRDNSHGASAKLTWDMERHALVVGADYDNGVGHFADDYVADQRDRVTKGAIYANDTINLGKLSVTPGVRYDHDRIIGSFLSPSLGITYELYEKTILRAFVARGFSSPPVSWATDTIPYGYVGNPDLKPEQVWSYQLGLETGILKYLWIKTSAFRHDISDAIVDLEIDPSTYTKVNSDKVRRQGIEVQFRTVPFYYCSFSGGATFIQTKNMSDGEIVHNVPKYTYDISMKYDDEKSLKALLTGHYIWWDSTKDGKYDSLIVDFNVIKRFYKLEDREAELFVTAHNIFDGEQHPTYLYKNPSRWVEAGIRFKF